MSNSLLSTTNHVESPFIIVKIGNYTLGHCAKENKEALKATMKVQYPDFITGISIVKVNGAVNTYTLKLSYAITQSNDPNLIDKILSSVSNTREIIFTYGDCNVPAYIYKEEKAIMTKVASSLSMEQSRIDYTITATSSALLLLSGQHNFPAKKAKPSDVLKSLFKNSKYGLSNIFGGMKNMTTAGFENFIASDDQEVQLQAKNGVAPLDYIGYLVGSMVNINDKASDTIRKYRYYWSTYDDIGNRYGGPYMKVVKVQANVKYTLSYNTYEIDVGYPTSNNVSAFTLRNDDSWALLYNFSDKSSITQHNYTIDNSGKLVLTEDPSITKSGKYFETTNTSRNWWTQVTQFPINATIVIKGLLRPAMLMSYVKVNTYFYGHKHISSGLYIITKQEDSINESGYRTTLNLSRISGDEMG